MDVSRRFSEASYQKESAPEEVIRVNVSWFGVVIEVSSLDANGKVISWLNCLFPSRIVVSPLSLQLEGPSQSQSLSIDFELAEKSRYQRQSLGVIDGSIDFHCSKTSAGEGQHRRECPVVAALSVKGGTGRTATAISFSSSWATTSGKPVLLVDADIEAPGISYLFEKLMGVPKISLEDLVVLAHADESIGRTETIDFVAERLRDQQVPGGIFILPIRRNLDELTSPSIRPEHLASPEEPGALADMLSNIALALGCCGVVIDVRAGMVPLGIHLAMDPDVSPIFVTTLADQSLRATAGLVRFFAREVRRYDRDLRRPLLVVNRVPSFFISNGLDEKLIAPLTGELVASLVPEKVDSVSSAEDLFDSVDNLDPFTQVIVPELIDLQVSSPEWNAYRNQMTASGFDMHLKDAFKVWADAELKGGDFVRSPIVESGLGSLAPEVCRQNLSKYANQLIAAENAEGGVPKPLVTQPLAALTGRFKSEVPIAISEGGKGTGKTLAARYLISQKLWDVAVEELLSEKDAVSARIVPVCASVQSSSNFQSEVDESRRGHAESMGLGAPMNAHASTAWLKHQISSSSAFTESEWTEKWLDVIAWCSGYKVNKVGVGESFLGFLRKSQFSVIALIEGLEELYNSTDDVGVNVAMRSLLVSLPQRLRSEAKRPLGLVVFARRDTVESAVNQNLDQYRREYSQFSLSWAEADVLELAAWLASQSGAIPGLWDKSFVRLSQDSMSEKLDALWGRKLGPDDRDGRRTREAYTAAWIVAVLSDLRGRLVPRDLVRFLSVAAAQKVDSDDEGNFPTRLLVPKALKAAVELTSTEKVKETEEEIRELAPIFRKFSEHRDQIAVPLGVEAIEKISLTNEEIAILVRHGIVYGDAPPYEVPELYRRGLGLTHAGARRSVVNLYRRARQKSV